MPFFNTLVSYKQKETEYRKRKWKRGKNETVMFHINLPTHKFHKIMKINMKKLMEIVLVTVLVAEVKTEDFNIISD